jgi:hypothetical protein
MSAARSNESDVKGYDVQQSSSEVSIPLEASPAGDAAYEQTRSLNATSTRANPVANPETFFSSAYGAQIWAKCGQALAYSDEHLITRQALGKLVELSHTPSNCYQLLKEWSWPKDAQVQQNPRGEPAQWETGSVLAGLLGCLRHEDAECRELASQVLVPFSNLRVGRDHLVKQGVTLVLSFGFDDFSETVRGNIYRVFLNLCDQRSGITSFVGHGVGATLVHKASEEKGCPAIHELCLQLLHRCINEEPEAYAAVLKQGVVDTLVGILNDAKSSDLILEWACRVACVFNIPRVGKKASVDAKMTVPLIKLLRDSASAGVREHAAGALVHLTQNHLGKVISIQNGLVEVCVAVVSEQSAPVELLANVLQVVANIAQHPTARTDASGKQPSVLYAPSTLQRLHDIDAVAEHIILKTAVSEALSRLAFKP